MEIFNCTFGIGMDMHPFFQPVYAMDKQHAHEIMKGVYDDYAFIYTEGEFMGARKRGSFSSLKPLPLLCEGPVITVGEMQMLTERFNQITSASRNIRKKRMLNMLQDVEVAYKADPFVDRLLETIREEIAI